MPLSKFAWLRPAFDTCSLYGRWQNAGQQSGLPPRPVRNGNRRSPRGWTRRSGLGMQWSRRGEWKGAN